MDIKIFSEDPRWVFPGEDSSFDEKKLTEDVVLVKFSSFTCLKSSCLGSTEDSQFLSEDVVLSNTVIGCIFHF